MLYFYKQHSLVQPEELHLNGDGVYFNIFTEDSRGEDTTGTLKNIGDDTGYEWRIHRLHIMGY